MDDACPDCSTLGEVVTAVTVPTLGRDPRPTIEDPVTFDYHGYRVCKGGPFEGPNGQGTLGLPVVTYTGEDFAIEWQYRAGLLRATTVTR